MKITENDGLAYCDCNNVYKGQFGDGKCESYIRMDRLIRVSLALDAIDSVDSTQSWEHWEANPGSSDFHVLDATAWANFPICWKSLPFRSLDMLY